MRKYFDCLLRSFATGICIAIGGIVYLSCPNKYIGAVLFGTGLFTVLTFGFDLFTGRVGYLVNNKPSYLTDLAVIWLGNLTGTAFTGVCILNTRQGAAVSEKASALCDVKLADSLPSLFILAFFCGMLMFIAADGFKQIPFPVGKMLAVFLPVTVFILSGFEHCVANMFYFTAAGAWSLNAFGRLIVMTLGNSAGGILIPLLRKGLTRSE